MTKNNKTDPNAQMHYDPAKGAIQKERERTASIKAAHQRVGGQLGRLVPNNAMIGSVAGGKIKDTDTDEKQ